MGICGTDVSRYLGKFPFFDYPRIPGRNWASKRRWVQVSNVKVVITTGRTLSELRELSKCPRDWELLRKPEGFDMMDEDCANVYDRADKLHPSEKLSFDQLALVEILHRMPCIGPRKPAGRGTRICHWSRPYWSCHP